MYNTFYIFRIDVFFGVYFFVNVTKLLLNVILLYIFAWNPGDLDLQLDTVDELNDSWISVTAWIRIKKKCCLLVSLEGDWAIFALILVIARNCSNLIFTGKKLEKLPENLGENCKYVFHMTLVRPRDHA